jgi:YidC/Oxa1 family membrane protein insertase
MDRNSAIGLTLIAVLLLVYFNFLAPTPTPPEATPAQVTSPVTVQDSLKEATTNTQPDSAAFQQYGNLSSFLTGNEEVTSVENSNLKIKLSNQGHIDEVELKNFKTYSQTPLFLASGGNNRFSLMANYEGKEVDLYRLYYTASTSKKSDTTLIIFIAKSVNPIS